MITAEYLLMNKPKLFMMIGLPGSGKSSKAKEIAELYNAKIHSSDEIRAEFGNVQSQDANQKVFHEMHKRIKSDLLNGNSVIYDATNINYKRRMSFLNEIRKYSCEKIAVLMALPYRACITNNYSRERQVPIDVITRMHKNLHIPYWYEGWDDIKIENYCDTLYLPSDFYLEYKDFDQENSHHTETLGDHCLAVSNFLSSDPLLQIAGILHDCGKPFTKSFTNGKGEITEEAHYYQHHLVGAYNSLFYLTKENPLDVAILIQWHMQPYFWEQDTNNGEKQRLKYERLWGSELYKKIMLLHEADKLAH